METPLIVLITLGSGILLCAFTRCYYNYSRIHTELEQTQKIQMKFSRRHKIADLTLNTMPQTYSIDEEIKEEPIKQTEIRHSNMV